MRSSILRINRKTASTVTGMKNARVVLSESTATTKSSRNLAVVMMTTETLGQMQDDMIALTGQIDQLTGIFRNMVAGGSISPEALETVLAGAAKLSDEVFDRWDNADMVAML